MFMAKRVRVTSFAGRGALVQGVGLLVPLILGLTFGWVGTLLGLIVAVVLFFKGSAMATFWRCGTCGNPLHDKQVRMCPVCRDSIH